MPPAASVFVALSIEREQPQGESPRAAAELDQRSLAPDVPIGARATGDCHGLRGGTGARCELGGDVAAGDPEHGSAVAQDLGSQSDDDAGSDVVADLPAVPEQQVVEDVLVPER